MTGLAKFLVCGYLSCSRTFAHLGLEPAKVFIGELALAGFIFAQPRVWGDVVRGIGKWRRFDSLRWTCAGFIGYGIFLLLLGVWREYPLLTAIENAAFHYYPLYFVFGIWAGVQNPNIVGDIIRVVAWVNGIYGCAYVLVLHSVAWKLPGTADVTLFGQPAGSAFAILALLATAPRLADAWLPLLLNVFVLIGIQVRAEWLGFCLGFVALALIGRHSRRLLVIIGMTACVGVLAFVADWRLPAPRGGEISVQGIAGRMAAPVAPDFAARYSDNTKTFAGTAEWRTRWWREIWRTINYDRSDITFFFGLGYGYPLSELGEGVPAEIRVPHNVFFYVLGYGGWIGVVAFGLFQTALLRSLYRSFRATGQPLGVIFWILWITSAALGNVLEGPAGAVPFYLLVGMFCAPLMAAAPSVAPKSGIIANLPSPVYPKRPPSS
jgi:hypothetical protein